MSVITYVITNEAHGKRDHTYAGNSIFILICWCFTSLPKNI